MINFISKILLIMSSILSPTEMNVMCEKIVGNRIEHYPLQISHYWPFHDNGELMDSWNGQCDSDCSVTADGTTVEISMRGKTGACLERLLGYSVWIDDKEVLCNDNFGNHFYRDPIYNPLINQCVIPLDLMSASDGIRITRNWRTNWQMAEAKGNRPKRAAK